MGAAYELASSMEKLEGTLVHFQGDNVLSIDGGQQIWSGLPRGQELFWELEVPNGIYSVTISLGDISNVDSRPSATVEGYTIIPAFVPTDGEVKKGNIIVQVSDGRITVNGLGGFNTKINYINIESSQEKPTNGGELKFESEKIEIEVNEKDNIDFSVALKDPINDFTGLVIEDNLKSGSRIVTGRNNWLKLPDVDNWGVFKFNADATQVTSGNESEATVIATATGFKPAILHVHVKIGDYKNIAPLVKDHSFSIWKEAELGTFIGDVNASDAEDDKLTYKFIGGNKDGDFRIDKNSGKIFTNQLLSKSALDYRLTIEVNDGINTSSSIVAIIATDSPVFEPLKVNFANAKADILGYLSDTGKAFGEREQGYVYGWLNTKGAPTDFLTNSRNRNLISLDPLQNTLIHMQYEDVGGKRGKNSEAIWEMQLPNGNYEVTVSVGDGLVDSYFTTPSHSINIENKEVIKSFVPAGGVAAPGRFKKITRVIEVKDGRLTVDARGGYNTKINFIEIKYLSLNFDKTIVTYLRSSTTENIEQNLILSAAPGITASDITLSTSKNWIILPEKFDLEKPLDISFVDGMSPGTYLGSITASAPGYASAEAEIKVEVAEKKEDNTGYKFNFRNADSFVVSPEGYIDDIGKPYHIENTVNGKFSFGWVEPGLFTPAENTSARNRTGGVIDALRNSFTHIGHLNTVSYPILDWILDIPNGYYKVKIGVGETNYKDSQHVIDVNGVNVINFDQENDNPNYLSFYENEKIIEVKEGALRMSLGEGGLNSKVDFITVTPINAGKLAPLVNVSFNGLHNILATYRGEVEISIDGVVRSGGRDLEIQYKIDKSTFSAYKSPIHINKLGEHILYVKGIDDRGNSVEEQYSFKIEQATGSLLTIENMTKIPYTNRGFPADDYYTFHRLGNPGKAQVHDSNIMRIHNPGTSSLEVENIKISISKLFTYDILSSEGEKIKLPLSVNAGDFVDVDIKFIGSTAGFTNGLFKERIDIVSNADNGIDGHAVLHGGYSPITEGGLELGAQSVFDVFGFKTSMLSMVNNEGTIDPVNKNRYRPSSNYPLAANIDAGYEGDLIQSPTFVQADPNKPIYGIQISAFHGKEGPSSTKFLEVNSSKMVDGGIYMAHSEYYHQTVLPRNKGNIDLINYGYSKSIKEPFRIAIGNYISSGGNDLTGNRSDLLGVRVYKVKNSKGEIVPNEYLVIHDYVGGGCGTGGGYNCDWNDNIFYFINIRPEAAPEAKPIKTLTATAEKYFSYDLSLFFNLGYAGNKLSFSATAGKELPEWLAINHISGILSGIPPNGSNSSYKLDVTAKDLNGIEVKSTLVLNISKGRISESKNDKNSSKTNEKKGNTSQEIFAETSSQNSLGLSEKVVDVSDYKITPNPATDKFSIVLPYDRILKNISVYDLKGAKVIDYKNVSQLNANDYTFSVDRLRAGVYLVCSTDNLGAINRFKLIIDK